VACLERARRSCLVAIVGVLAAVSAWTETAARRPGTGSLTPVIVLRDLAQALPAGMQAPGSDWVRVASLITTDLDADGDLDVVATDGSSALVVWTNDGNGRLTRKPPRRASDLTPEPPPPSLTPHQQATLVSVQNDAPSLQAGAGAASLLIAAQPLVYATPSVGGSGSLGVRSPRAPPSPLSV
jgi:FG-GAP-like repeat